MPFNKTLPRSIVICLLASMAIGLLPSSASAEGNLPYVYPKAKKVDQVDTYHGVDVPDPYRWLENPDAPESRVWIEAQNRLTMPFLEAIPQREGIAKRLTELWNYEKYGMPYQHGGRYFSSKNDGLQNQSVIYWADSLKGKPHVLLDPNKLLEDGTMAISGWEPSPDGRWFAYGLSDAGSDWQEWRVRDVATGKDAPDHIKWIKFSSASWTKDNKGFFYTRYDEPKAGQELQSVNYFPKLYYHRLGTKQADDRLIYERKDHKDWGFSGEVTEDGRYLVIRVSLGTARKYQLFYKDLTKPDSKVVELIAGFDALYSFVDNDGPVFWVRTDLDAPRSRVIAVNTEAPQRENWREVIAETDDTLSTVSVAGEKFFARYLADAHSRLRIYNFAGRATGEVKLPGLGTSSGMSGRRGDPEAFYSFSSYNTPSIIYRYDVPSGKSEVFRKPNVAFNPSDFVTKQVFYKSKDGTKIPMFISHRKGLKPTPDTPTLLYGYGGFNISITPRFRISAVVWMEMGGVYAVANIRGGGEYGREWHEAGMKTTKQNSFDDFIAGAEWLIANKKTSPSKLAIQGGSNGGLLVGACMTQRPDLFGACLPAVGVMDMLRFREFTIGWAWESDYGSVKNPDEFKALLAYSPLHNLKAGTAYPPTLITTGDHDDRVVPAHSFKFAAALQAAQSGPAPTLIRIETRAGHGAGKPTSMRIAEAADMLAFLTKTLGVSEK